jgi:hypothetical protein
MPFPPRATVDQQVDHRHRGRPRLSNVLLRRCAVCITSQQGRMPQSVGTKGRVRTALACMLLLHHQKENLCWLCREGWQAAGGLGQRRPRQHGKPVGRQPQSTARRSLTSVSSQPSPRRPSSRPPLKMAAPTPRTPQTAARPQQTPPGGRPARTAHTLSRWRQASCRCHYVCLR